MEPIWRIDADGATLGAQANAALVDLTVTDNAGFEADALNLTIDNQGGLFQPPRRGATLTVYLGFRETSIVKVGDFVVDYAALKGPVRTIEVGAAALDLRIGARSPRTREWKDTTLGDIAAAIAGEHDLTARVAADLAGVAYSHVSQTAESDVHFLTRLGVELGATVKVAEGNLVIAVRGAGQTISGQTLPTIGLQMSDFTEWGASEGDRQKYESCVAYWADRKGAKKAEVIVGSGEPQYEMTRTFATEGAARRAANARLKRLNSSTRQLTGALAIGRPEMRAEQPLETSFLDEMSNGRWITTSVTHRLAGAFTTTFTAEPLT